MSAPLSKELFHGTGETFKVGDVIKPQGHRVAHATTSSSLASTYAELSTDPKSSRTNHPSLFGVVYKVEPVDHKEVEDTTHSEGELRTAENDPKVMATSDMRFSKKGFKVTGVHSTVPNSEDIAIHNIKKRKEKREAEAVENAKWEEASERHRQRRAAECDSYLARLKGNQ